MSVVGQSRRFRLVRRMSVLYGISDMVDVPRTVVGPRGAIRGLLFVQERIRAPTFESRFRLRGVISACPIGGSRG
jgi:hypothetical protein